jgi:serine/threonine protein kinase/tetratricopeptide (TPR) repeat protein
VRGPLQAGSLLGARYEILQMLGQGGMGAVYKARDRELDRLVAIKVIRPDLAGDPDILKRFKQELILARQVTHKNVVRIFDLGEAEGFKFITMEYVEGRDLKSILAERAKLPPEEAVGIMEQVCRALDAAHTEGVVHRDLKPQNIMLDNEGKVLVMDFGIARSVESSGLTQTGALVGTPEYMSPEQAKGEDVDVRSDLFTLGIIFYQLLTGKVPFKANTTVATLLKRTQERAVPPVKEDPSVPLFLSDVVDKCLEIDTKHRYQKASEILADLEAHRQPRGTSLLLRLPHFRTVEEFRTRWVAPVLSVALLLAVGIVFRGKIFGPSTKPKSTGPAISLAILPFRNASGDPSLDLGTSFAEMLSTDVGQSAYLQTIPPDRLQQVLHDLRIAPNSSPDPDTIGLVAKSLNAQTVVWGTLTKLGDRIHVEAALRDLRKDRGVSLKDDAPNVDALPATIDRLARAIRENLSLSSSVLKELEAQAFKPSSTSVPALRDYNEGLELARQGNYLQGRKRFEAATQGDPGFALAYSKLGEVDSALGYDGDAEQASRKAVGLSHSLPAPERYRIEANHARIMRDYPKAIEAYQNLLKAAPGDMEVQFSLAGIYEDMGLFDQAREVYSRMLTSDPKHLDAQFRMGGVEVQSGNPQKGLEYLNGALTVAVEVGNEEERANILRVMGVAYLMLNKFDEALRDFQASLEIMRRLEDKKGIADSLYAMAEVHDSLGKPDLALKGYNEALQLRREIGDKRGMGNVLIDLGDFYNTHGNYDQALKLSQEALRMQRDVGNEKLQALALNNIGAAYFYKGRYDDARTYYEQALQQREKLKVPGNIADSLHNLAETSTYMGEYGQALDYYLRALELRRGAGDKRGAAIDSSSMGVLFDYRGQYGAAVSSDEEALKSFRQLGERSNYLAEILNAYGHALAKAGRREEAQKALEEALALDQELKNQSLVAQTLGFQGDVFFYNDELAPAKRLYDQALQIATRTADRERILISKFNLAKVAVKEGHFQEGISVLRSLAQDADDRGLKYLSIECSTYVAEALIKLNKYSEAQRELEEVVSRSEKLGLHMQLATAHYLLGTALRLAGKGTDAASHYRDAVRLLDEVRKEPGANKTTERPDLKLVYAECSRWAQPAKG